MVGIATGRHELAPESRFVRVTGNLGTGTSHLRLLRLDVAARRQTLRMSERSKAKENSGGHGGTRTRGPLLASKRKFNLSRVASVALAGLKRFLGCSNVAPKNDYRETGIREAPGNCRGRDGCIMAGCA
jgi:hypothetical protein